MFRALSPFVYVEFCCVFSLFYTCSPSILLYFSMYSRIEQPTPFARLNLVFTLLFTEAATRGVLRNFAKFTGKHLCQSLFSNKVVDLRPAFLLKKRSWHRCFPVSFTKFRRTPFYRTPLGDCFCIAQQRKEK